MKHELVQLAGKIEVAVSELGFARERRPFAPHLTLARLPEGLPAKAGQEVIAIAGSVDMPTVAPFNVERVSLMRSHLRASGAVHERIAAVPEA